MTFDEYRNNWLEDVRAGTPSTLELGQRFGRKLLTQWLDIDTTLDDLDLVYCDGTGDGGIDIAYLYRGRSRSSDSDSPSEGDVWYLVQSKYGSAFRGVNTILEESRKVIDTLEGRRRHLSSLTEDLLDRLTIFRGQTSDLDRLVLVFATEDSLSGEENRMLNDVRTIGRERIGPIFDVDSVSIRTIYQRILQNKITETSDSIEVTINARLDNSGQDLRVGTVTLLELYNFLKAYKDRTGDLNLLYEKNVRRSLGNRTRVNSKIRKTLQEAPEQFGLYNNGITIVVTDFRDGETGALDLIEPYIVNGCQTTQMIWEVCQKQLGSGGTGTNSKTDIWCQKAGRGVVVAKIVKVGPTGTSLLRDIARYTNSQNAIREQDFLALESDFTVWADQMKKTYDVFLEIQRGEWDSQRAFQKQHPHTHRFERHANAFDPCFA